MLLLHIRAKGLPLPVREYRPFPDRRFRLDLAYPTLEPPLGIEVDGGEYLPAGGGRHNRAAGMAADYEKQNRLAVAGWQVLRFTGQMVKDGRAIALLHEVFWKAGYGE